jgi:hypothetical protein
MTRHTANLPEIYVLARDDDSASEADRIVDTLWCKVVKLRGQSNGAARVHGSMIDEFLTGCDLAGDELIMTMDSDCFPIADGWLDGLIAMMDSGAKVSGILHPWAPPPKDMDRKLIEWRIRSQHCWESTHVACQMIRASDLWSMRYDVDPVSYSGGDDTGMLIPLRAHQLGWKIDGYKVTRCPKPAESADPEFNRYASLVFGDMIYHCGGFTRIRMGDTPVMEENYGWARKRMVECEGAEFLLDGDHSHRFRFDREEEVAKEKMCRLFGHDGSNLKCSG